jgi:hypothetical protein
MTLVPFLAVLALVALGATPFVGPFALAIFLAALALWIFWKAVANLLGLWSDNVFRLAETSDLLGRGGPDDPDFVLVPRRPHGAEEEAATDEDELVRISPIDRADHGAPTESPA